jgi:hypothetical protein
MEICTVRFVDDRPRHFAHRARTRFGTAADSSAPIDQKAQPAALGGTCQEVGAVTERQLDCSTFLMSRRGGAILLE